MAGAGDAAVRGRRHYARREWRDAHAALSDADRAGALEADDLELLATSAYMLGRSGEHLRDLERACQAHVDAGRPRRGARCAFWIGMHLFMGGETGRGTGWLGRARRLVEREDHDCVERAYLLLPLMLQREAAGELAAAGALAADAAAAGERFGDVDLFALAVHAHGHVRIKEGHVAEGLALLDEAMLAVTSGAPSPVMTGLVYCGVILACQDAFEPRRAREWTAALARWCDLQADLVPFTGRCLVHRAEILQLDGSWEEALDEARRAGPRCAAGGNEVAAGEAAYVEGELHRLRGELADAEAAYREASERGREPQPGLALLRLAQGRGDAAAASSRRALSEAVERPRRAALLPAHVEIMLAIGDAQVARAACRELADIAALHRSEMLDARAALARGAVEMAGGDARAALPSLRRAGRSWQELGVPYEAARARTLVGLACRELGDGDAAGLELHAARAVFERLGAAADLARVDALLAPSPAGAAGGLTAREVEVLRLVAAGRTNKAIASELVLSDRTVDRHVSNILSKLGVASRAAATAHAYEHGLLL